MLKIEQLVVARIVIVRGQTIEYQRETTFYLASVNSTSWQALFLERAVLKCIFLSVPYISDCNHWRIKNVKAYLEKSMMMNDTVLILQQAQQRVFRV